MRAFRCIWVLALTLVGCRFHIGGVGGSGQGGGADLASPTGDDGGVASPDLAAPDLAAPPPPPPILMGNVDSVVATPVDLDALGTSDWAHWGYADQNSFDHKVGGNNRISNFTNLKNTPINQANGYPIEFTWIDGTPTISATNNTTGVWTQNQGSGGGFRITVPADTTLRTLRIWAGGQQSTAAVTAHLTDGSHADYMQSASDTNNFQRLITLTYRAATPCMLRVDWALQSGMYVHLQSAALQ